MAESPFKTLSGYLEENKKKILVEWKDNMIVKSHIANELYLQNRQEFYNTLPEFLDALFFNLQKLEEVDLVEPNGRDSIFEAPTEAHGRNRWSHGFELEETINDWSELQRIISEVLERARNEFSFPSEIFYQTYRLLSVLIHRGIKRSIDMFFKLERDRAQVKVKTLQAALDSIDLEKSHLRHNSHDLKGLVFSIKMGLMVLRDEELSTRPQSLLKDLEKSTESLELLLGDMLELFRLEAGQQSVNVTSFDASKVLTDLCSSLKFIAKERNLDLITKGEKNLMVEGDEKKVLRLANNILVNALKYTLQGTVEICWDKISQDYWQLSIKDTGPGLPPTKKAIFSTELLSEKDSLQQELNDVEGYEEDSLVTQSDGIGLLIVRRLATLLEATIDVRSSDDGTEFNILFPINYGKEKFDFNQGAD